ncbi:UbiD family decarboxylase [Acidipila sp. EB88]|uniref:UbiD family decarboxylase n=1 Tax=Acidipila sp. EB88 TaxID=2305226 RepID=UPI000F5F8994|nr:UbiD family decarboxylase [Acidipila sp. EB88]RRA48917.1 UbiD family decarboxylase [Acidipila sp. EB88]
MPYQDLREWIKALDRAGELVRVREEVDPILEIAEITDRASKAGKRGAKAGGPALLFEKVKGYPGARVLMNQFGSEARMKLAVDVDSLDEVAGRIRALLEMKSPDGLLGKLKLLPMLADVGKFFPKTIAAKQAACKEVIKIGKRGDRIDVLEFPVLQCWPMDGGRYITLPCVVTRDPKTGKRNVGMYRIQVYDGQTTGMHWQRQKNAAEHLRDRMRAQAGDAAARVAQMAQTAGGTVAAGTAATSEARGGATPSVTYTKQLANRLEVAVAIGTDPATTFSAIVPAPPEVEEYIVAGFLRQKPLELVQCETVDLQVPAHAEIILEGFVKLDELRSEGPFGDHTGFYTMEDEYPVFHITAITHRKNPIYAATIVGKPPMEDAWMGKAVERIFLPLMRLTLPEIVDINLPVEGVFHNIMVVSIRKSYAGHARKVMNGIWALGQAMFTKCIVVVDEDCDVQDLGEVVLRTANNIDPERDIQFTLGPVDSLDHASRLPNFGSKMGIDATQKWPAEGFNRVWPPMIEMDAATKARVDSIWGKLGIK